MQRERNHEQNHGYEHAELYHIRHEHGQESAGHGVYQSDYTQNYHGAGDGQMAVCIGQDVAFGQRH